MKFEKYYSLLQTINHLRHYEMANNHNSEIKKRMLRIDYMLNNINDEQSDYEKKYYRQDIHGLCT